MAGIEDHIRKFWDRRMRDMLLLHFETLQVDLLIPEAAERLARARQDAAGP